MNETIESLAAVGLPLLAAVLGFAWLFRRWHRDDRRKAGERDGTAVDRAELLLLQGGWQGCADLAWPVLDPARRAKASARDQACAHLLIAECEAACERRDAAIAHLDAAGALMERLRDGPDRARLAQWTRCAQAGLGPGPGARPDWPAPDPLLAETFENDTLDPTIVLRLAGLAVWRANAERHEGSWPRARAHFEQAVRLGESVPAGGPPGVSGEARSRAELLGALARARAASAAGEIGAVLASLGRHDEATVWLDRAIAACEPAVLPQGRIARARAQIIRGMHEPADAILGFEPRRRHLRAALADVEGVDWPAARALTARAEIQLGALAAQEGDAASARAHFESADRRLAGLDLPGVAELVAEAHLLLGHVLEDHGELDDARVEYRRALDAGREDADADARRLAAVSGCHLHRLLHHADRTDEARALLEPLESVAPTLAPAARPLVAAMVARCRGQQQFRDGEREEADRSFSGAMALVDAATGPEAIDLARQIAAERGNLALSTDRAADAEAHLRRALAAIGGTRPAAIEQAEHAEIHLRLAQTLLEEDRPNEARPELSAAFEGGRDSGRANGRSVAAAAALLLGDDPESELPERRVWYESAARFGRLSGTERGRQVEAVVAERLRELMS